MRITVFRGKNGESRVNFQPENAEELENLDKILGFEHKPIPVEGFPQNSKAVGEIGGHESQRWITISSKKK